MSEQLRHCWSRSRVYRVVLVIAVVYAVVRLAVHGAYLAMMLYPNAGIMGGTPEWAGGEGEPMVPVDLQVYLDAAQHLRSRQDLYLQDALDSIEYHFPYPPFYALAFVPFLWLSPLGVSFIHTLIHLVSYGVMYVGWYRIFHRLECHRANEMLAWTLPVWLIFTSFWSDLGYLNVYIIMALLATLLIDAVLKERLGWALLWLSLILQTKPMWAFAVAVPLLLGHYRFFFKLMVLAVVAYIAIAGFTILMVGPAYGWEQYADYVQLLSRLGRDFPWRGPEAPFLGYNHSIKQIAAYVFGPSPLTLRLATMVKVLLLAPLAVICLRRLTRPAGQASYTLPRLSLDLAFALYLGAFIWLDVVWELSLGIVVFTYLLATLERQRTRILVWVVFLPYALVDFLQFAGFAVFGMDVIAPGPYILTDPSIYVPMVMIVILTFYALLVKRLWQSLPIRRSTGLVSS
jgi:hypothetical protein